MRESVFLVLAIAGIPGVSCLFSVTAKPLIHASLIAALFVIDVDRSKMAVKYTIQDLSTVKVEQYSEIASTFVDRSGMRWIEKYVGSGSRGSSGAKA